MENRMELLETLLKKDCYIVDYLPETVSATSSGQFFEVEYYLLNSEKHILIKDKFVGMILKLMCYYRISIFWKNWIDHPKPVMIEQVLSEIMTNHSGTLHCLFPDENALLVFDWDCLNLAVYNPSEKMQRLFEQIVFSEGLFWRLSPS